ncbi:MAG: hypothetical protein ACMG6S_35855, partial [Byssovorax sp.]
GLEAAAFRCLEKKPEARFANVGELAWAIAEYGPPEARASAEKTVRTLEAAGVRVQRTTEASGAHRAPSAPAIAIAIAQPRSVPPHSAATLSGASTLVFAQTRTRKPLVMAGVAVSVALAATVVGLMMRSAPPPSEHGNATAVSAAVPDDSATPVAVARKPATGPGSPARPASPAPSAAAAPTTTAKSNPLDIRIKE